MHRHRIAGQQRLYKPMPNEPDEVVTGARVNQRRSRHPDDVALTPPLGHEQPGDLRVIDGFFARHLARHEVKVAADVARVREAVRVHEHALATVFGGANDNRIALSNATTFAYPPPAVAATHEATVHPGFARHSPRAVFTLHI